MSGNLSRGRRLALVVAFTLAINALLPTLASAGALTNTYVRLNRMSAGTQTSARVVFKTAAGAAVEDNVRVDFKAAWTNAAGAVNLTQTVAVAACATETGATSLPGTTLSAAGSGAVITVSGVADLAASTAYCFDLTSTSAVTLPTAGEYYVDVTTQTGGTVVDVAKLAVRVVSNDSITVTATVPPTFNFQLDANTTAFVGDLTPGTKRETTSRTVTVNTNAKTGWVAWLRNADTNGLYSAGVNHNIAPTTPGTAVDVDTALTTEQYVWGVDSLTQVAGAGTPAITAAYDSSGLTNDGSGVDNAYRQVASSTGTSQDAVVTLTSSATISGITPASSDYTDVVQVIGAGNF
ncbi:MAG TPA: hypothetical protein VK983_01150 [Candidatus Limnocylindrales bacterium]|nr:hypothetical protein [Candidatus Limnocylindrales bacterium]